MKSFNLILSSLIVALAVQTNVFAQSITPQNLTVNYASTATFTASPTNATSYLWRLNDANLTDGTNSDGAIVTGSRTDSLTVEDVTSNEIGTYDVIITELGPPPPPPTASLNVIPGTLLQFTFSGLTNAPGSNVVVALFDNDKPVTVQNFLHYVRSNIFTNMFFERCVPGFILQGGDYDAADQTNTNQVIIGSNVASLVTNPVLNPPFPVQIVSEYGVGPQIKNDFGTLAMALNTTFDGAQPDSAQHGFFFNLADNSSNLDSAANGPFTVFGRVVNGTNVLAYFNTLTNNNGIVSNEVLSDNGVLSTNPFPTLPVNYSGSNAPANTNLIFADFTLEYPLPGETTLPTVAITSPADPAPVTNLQGTASDDLGVALVTCVLTPIATDGVYPYPYTNGALETNYATGTTNWSLALSPGSYNVSVQSQNGAGYLSTAASEQISVTAIITNGYGTVSFTNSANNPVGYPLQVGASYDVLATPDANNLFLQWGNDEATNVNPLVSFGMSEGFNVTASFVSNGIPNGIAFTYPPANAVLSTNAFNITGSISSPASPPVTVNCTLFSQPGGFSIAPPMTTMGTTSWSVPITNGLAPGAYTIQALATDQDNKNTVIEQSIIVSAFIINGEGSVSMTSGGTNIANPTGFALQDGTTYTVKATPATGQTFVNWSYPDGGIVTTNTSLTFTYEGGVLTATFISTSAPKGTKSIISFTYPAANAKLATNSFIMKGRIAASVKTADITCQIFSLTTSNQPISTLSTSGTGTWSVPVSNLPPDEYLVQAVATNSGGYCSVISERFFVEDFKEVYGTYTGLFLPENVENVSPTNSGLFTFTVNANGIFSGRLYFPAYNPIPVEGAFYLNNGEGYFNADGETDLPLKLSGNPAYLGYLSLALTNGSDELTGYVYSSNFSWVSPLTCYRSITKIAAATNGPAKGKYIMGLYPTNAPATNAYAALSVSSGGTAAVSGALPDGTAFSQSAGLSDKGVWPLYVVPSTYKKTGMLIGWETWQTNGDGGGDYTGPLYWYKGSGLGDYYTSGVDTNVSSVGTNYTAPAAGSYSIIFYDYESTNSVPITNGLTVEHTGGQFMPGTTSDKLAVSLSANGVLSGHFDDGVSAKPLQFKGAFFGQSAGGSGFILGGNGQSGYFILTNAP